MWHTLVTHLSEVLHRDFKLINKQQLSSSNHDLLYKVSDKQQSFFVKICPKGNLDKYEQERLSLNTLTTESLFYVPDSVAIGLTTEFAYHIIEWLDLSEGDQSGWYNLGATLANMHKKHEQKMFGFEWDNYIGLNTQPNDWHKHWDSFFAEQRIGFQLQLLSEKNIQLVDIDNFVQVVKDALHHHHCTPSLLHGDLWRGNVGFCQNKPCVFDPASYYGDRETDLAMTELFGKFHHDFYEGYLKTYPLPDGYQQRKLIYNLYHQLNHANIFGNQYVEDAHISIVKIQQNSGWR